MRRSLFGQLSDIPGLAIDIGDEPLCALLLFGDPQLNVVSNRKILEAMTSFFKNTKRFCNSI